MKLFIRAFLLIWAVICLTDFSSRPATAHGTGHRILDATAAMVVEFVYSDNQPMRYAEVLVFSPEHEDFEYQNGRTDMNGRFAFYPTTAGQWRVQADDGTGHLERVAVDITAAGGDDPTNRGITTLSLDHGHPHTHNGLSRLWSSVLGLSLIVNVFLAGYLFKSKRS